MKMLLTSFFSLTLVAFLVLWNDQYNDPLVDKDFKASAEFTKLTTEGFEVNGKPFYPKVINYMVTLQYNDTAMWPCIYPGYEPDDRFKYGDPDSCRIEMLNQFIKIHDLGFNTLRIVNIGEAHVIDKQTQKIGFKGARFTTGEHMISVKTDEEYRKYFKAIETLLDLVAEAGLKAIFTIRLFHESSETEEHFKKLAAHFRNQPAILAYDFFNEPLYFDSLEHRKSEVYAITKHWHDIRKRYAPGQLSTIGLACQREMFEWDPNLVQCDFISFHPYDYEPEQVKNEMYWYKTFVNKPWIVGETGRPSNNDSIPYEYQVRFAEKTMLQAVRCGGRGYSWWQFMDVDWSDYHQNYLGVVKKGGETMNSRGAMVYGTPKPVTKTIAEFDPYAVKGPCECMPNYYNYSGHKDYRIIGKLVNKEGQPINNGGILAWDEPWVNHYFSTTKPDGTFAIYSNYKFYHWMVTGLEREMIRSHCNFDTAKVVDGIPTIDLGTITLKDVL